MKLYVPVPEMRLSAIGTGNFQRSARPWGNGSTSRAPHLNLMTPKEYLCSLMECRIPLGERLFLNPLLAKGGRKNNGYITEGNKGNRGNY